MAAPALELRPIQVAVLRGAEAPAPDPALYRRACADVFELSLGGVARSAAPVLCRALAETCGALVVDDPAVESDGEGWTQAAEEAELPLVLAYQAVRVRDAAAVLARAARLEKPLGSLRVGLAGEQAQALRGLLVALGFDEERIYPRPTPAPGEERPTPPARPEDLYLAVVSPGIHAPEADEAAARVDLLPSDPGLALPSLVRAAADAKRPPGTAALVAVAQALAELASEGRLPEADDPRLLLTLAPAAAAALEAERFGGVGYRRALEELRSPVRRALRRRLAKARDAAPTLVFTHGEDARALEAARALADDGLAAPWLLGDQFRIEARAKGLGVALKGLRVVDPHRDRRREGYAEAVQRVLGPQRGVTAERAAELVEEPLLFAGAALLEGEAQGVVVTAPGEGLEPLGLLADLLPRRVLGRAPARSLAGLHLVADRRGAWVVADTAGREDPTSEELADAAHQAALAARDLLGLEPRTALVGFTNYGATSGPAAERLARARDVVRARDAELVVDGPLRLELALDAERLAARFPGATLGGPANALVLAGRDAALALVDALGRAAEVEVAGPLPFGLVHALAVAPPEATAHEVGLLAVVAAAQATLVPATPAEEGTPGGTAARATGRAEAGARPGGAPRATTPRRTPRPVSVTRRQSGASERLRAPAGEKPSERLSSPATERPSERRPAPGALPGRSGPAPSPSRAPAPPREESKRPWRPEE